MRASFESISKDKTEFRAQTARLAPEVREEEMRRDGAFSQVFVDVAAAMTLVQGAGEGAVAMELPGAPVETAAFSLPRLEMVVSHSQSWSS
ncbi:hypothetical protein CK221_01885 [Mesorhizobium sp. WSM3868]|nr:hypothetical protein CK221_01885 [Mesorhizobium sp. WSM3868]